MRVSLNKSLGSNLIPVVVQANQQSQVKKGENHELVY